MKIAIVGAGWVGAQLAEYLSAKGHCVMVTTTSPEKISGLQKVADEVQLLDFENTYNADFLAAAEMVIFSMPVARASWHEGFTKLNIALQKTLFFSSTGIYPQLPLVFTEKYQQNLRADIVISENLVRQKFPDTVILRFGGLMGAGRSVKRLFSHRQPKDLGKRVNHIHAEDILNIIELLLTAENPEPVYNIVAPEHPTLAEILNLPLVGEREEQRLISPELFIRDFNYKFIHPNPADF